MNSHIASVKYKYIVTLKKYNKGHDPKNKVEDECLTSDVCTDSTGHHHSVLVIASSPEAIRKFYWKRHVTRIERVVLELNEIA